MAHKCTYIICGTAMDSTLACGHLHGTNNCTHMQTHTKFSIQHNQFTWLAAAANQLPLLSCGQLVHNRAISCTNVYLNILQAIPPSWVGGPPLFIAVNTLIHVSGLSSTPPPPPPPPHLLILVSFACHQNNLFIAKVWLVTACGAFV